ncbi:MAG: hypothetical protein IJD43_05860 [Thermoguttaceae bacterium]|nr:hypothetical protein [Planctomycetaceae bacterium]MBQ4142983.1 hypothetical protein [Thermoguttaceae bacterium]
MLFFAFLRLFDCLYAIPMILATGLVYAASRNENTQEIFAQGLRLSAWIAGFMLLGLVLMLVLF